jgi:hypothetical protein
MKPSMGLFSLTEPKLQFNIFLPLKSTTQMHFIDKTIPYIDIKLLKNCYLKLISTLVS